MINAVDFLYSIWNRHIETHGKPPSMIIVSSIVFRAYRRQLGEGSGFLRGGPKLTLGPKDRLVFRSAMVIPDNNLRGSDYGVG